MLCEGERACDDAVVLGGWSGPQFARDLLDIVQFDGKGATPALTKCARLGGDFETRTLNGPWARRLG
jgi:hypothetical protein